MKKMMLATLMAFSISGVAMARPKVTVSTKKHPNIAAAQKLVKAAFDKVTAAQKANEYDLEGHAAKAKDLLDQASVELKAAAEASNEKAAEPAPATTK